MRLAAAAILFIPVLSFFILRDKRNLLAPINAFSLLYFLRVVFPAILFSSLSITGDISDGTIREAVMSDSNYFLYALLQTASYYCVVFGIKVSFRGYKLIYECSDNETIQNTNSVIRKSDMTYRHYLYWGIAFTLIGFIDFFLILQNAGGFVYFFTHLKYRTIILRDLDLLSWLLVFLHYGPLLMVYSMRGRKSKISIILYIIIIIAGFMCGLGGRKTLILMLIEMVFVYHFTVKNITLREILSMKNIVIGVFVFAYFIVFATFRREGAIESFFSNPIVFINDNNRSLFSIITGESYVKYYITIIDYFKNHALWLGRSFLGLATAFIPSSIYPAKPPVDDGMYLYSICLGRQDIIPIMPTNALNLSSYPLETFGSMYANYGVIGLFIGMIILGRIISRTYKRLERRNFQVVDIIIYTQILFTFELSTLRIFQVLETLIMLAVIVYFVDRLKLSFGHKMRGKYELS